MNQSLMVELIKIIKMNTMPKVTAKTKRDSQNRV